jgi:hypothetical protein
MVSCVLLKYPDEPNRDPLILVLIEQPNPSVVFGIDMNAADAG